MIPSYIQSVTLKNVFVLFFLVFINLNSSAQTDKRFIKEGDIALEKGDRKAALNLYLQAHQKNPNNAETNYKIGRLYLTSTYTHRSLSYLEKAHQLNPKVDKQLDFFLGMSYQVNLKFNEAIECYTKYMATLPAGDPLIAKVERRIYECNNGKEFLANPVPVKIENLGTVVNSAYPDFAPVISADETVMIFTSRRPGSTGELLDESGDYFEDIYVSYKVNGNWGTPQNIGSMINTDGHDASIGLSADGTELFIYKDEGAGDIYYCKKRKDGTWSKPMPIEGLVNNRKYYENAASLSPDGKTLFFASNREGGIGGLDIYMVTMDDKGFWSKPVNLGPEINTPEDEEGPFMDFDGITLYFSSRSHKGMGGFDIFKTMYDSTSHKWTTPVNMGYPINSADDDIYFVLSGDGAHGYYASAKEDGFGEKDIYRILMPPREDREVLIKKMKAMNLVTVEVETPVITETKPITTPNTAVLLPVILKGVVKDMSSGKPIQSVVQLTDAAGKVVSTVTTGADGLYRFEVSNQSAQNYTLSTEKSGYGFASKNVTVPANAVNKQEITQNLALQTLSVGNIFVLRNIYFDTDQATLKPESNVELNKLLTLLKSNPNMSVELSGHTDSQGSAEYNQALSQRRAQAVVNWLVAKGISKSRLVAKGYGETRPLASNDDENEGRELNRRTEFKILKN